MRTLAPTSEIARDARRLVVSRQPPRPSLLRGSTQALEASQALLRSQAALLRRDAERWAGSLGLGLGLAAAAGVMLAAAWTLAVIAAVMAADTVALSLRLAAVAGLHAALGAALLYARARVARRSHG